MKSPEAPKIYFYNPTCEIAIANNTLSFMPNKMLTRFESDLDLIPIWFAEENDIVLVHQLPDATLISDLKAAGVPIPQIQLFEQVIRNDEFIQMPKHSLHPWGWSPRIHHQFKDLKASCSREFLDQPNAFWKDQHRELYSREKALEVLQSLLEKSNDPLLIEKEKIAQICTKEEEIELLLQKWGQIVIKAPWSSSGRGLQVLRQSTLNASIRQWIKGTLSTQAYVMVEALLHKKSDFSFQFYIDGKGDIEFLGNAFFQTNSNGQYNSNFLGEIPKELSGVLSAERRKAMAEMLMVELKQSGIHQEYCGFMGIDCLLYTDRKGRDRIQPCLEINLRYNMGILCVLLERYLHPNSKGMFCIYFQPGKTFDQFHAEMRELHPFEMKEGKWHKGFLPLVSYTQNKQFGAYVLLEEK